MEGLYSRVSLLSMRIRSWVNGGGICKGEAGKRGAIGGNDWDVKGINIFLFIKSKNLMC